MTSCDILLISLCIFLLAVFSAIYIWRRRKVKPVCQEPNLTEWDIQCMAYHEAGHAVCSFYLPEREPLRRITILPGDEAFGMIQTAERPHHNETEISLRSAIITLLGGPMSEESFLQNKTTSGIHDFFNARQIAVDMVTKFGMGKTLKRLSAVSVYDGSYLLFGEKMKDCVDSDVLSILEESSDQCLTLLKLHSLELENLAHLLLERHTLCEEEIDSFFRRH